MTPEQLAALHRKSFTLPRPWSAREFAGLLGSDAVFLCAVANGFALGRIAGPEVDLLTLAVDPAHRRKGIAQNLIQRFATYATANGASEAFLEVAEDNTAAIALYRRFGFIKAGLRKDYYATPKGIGISALVMRKKL